MDLITQIKERLSLADLLSKLGIQVQKNGFCKSIYKEEKTPSLKIDFSKNLYYDFSAGEGGDVLKFYKDYYRLDYNEAIKQLAGLLGITESSQHTAYCTPTPPVQPQPEEFIKNADMLPNERTEYTKALVETGDTVQALKAAQKIRLMNNSEVFMTFYQLCLQDDYDKDIYNYLNKDRMISGSFIWKFKLFTIDNYYRINNALKDNYSERRLLASGLVNDKGNLIFAKHRLIIPYLWDNKIVYLRGRWFDREHKQHTPEGAPKYIGLRNDSLKVNTPKRFYNAFQLKTMLKGERVFLTEGEFDCIIAEQIGLNAIGLPGVGNIPHNLNKLKDLHVVLSMDNDQAGKNAVNKLINLFVQNNIHYTIADIFKDKDISDWYKNRNTGAA